MGRKRHPRRKGWRKIFGQRKGVNWLMGAPAKNRRKEGPYFLIQSREKETNNLDVPRGLENL